jgi:hypothetical protein
MDMNGKQFIRQATKWAKASGAAYSVDASRGKGGHQLLTIGAHRTTVKTGEIGPGLFRAMLAQLNIPKEDF